MAVSYIGGASAASTTVSLPAGTAAGDLALVIAHRTNATPPTVATGWISDDSGSGGSGGSAHSSALGWKILAAADITAGNVGTWTNATGVQVGVYRGASRFQRNGITANLATSTTLTLKAQTGLATGSWQVGVAAHRGSGANTVKSRTFTNYTNRSSGFTNADQGLWDSNGTTAGLAIQTATVSTSSGHEEWTGEIVVSPLAIPGAIYHFDHTDTSTITQVSGAVSAVATKSGHPVSVVQAASANKPVSGTRTMNALNVIDFDGSDDFLDLDITDLAQPFTIMAVFQGDVGYYQDTFPEWNWSSGTTEQWAEFFSGTLTASTDFPEVGSYSLKHVQTGGGNAWFRYSPGWGFGTGDRDMVLTPAPSAYPGLLTNFFADLRVSAASRWGIATVDYYNSAGQWISQAAGTNTALTSGAYTRVGCESVAPAGAVSAGLTIKVASTADGLGAIPLGEAIYLDEAWYVPEFTVVGDGSQLEMFLHDIVAFSSGAFSWQGAGLAHNRNPALLVGVFGGDGTTVGSGRSFARSLHGTGSQSSGFGTSALTRLRVGSRSNNTWFYNGTIAEWMVWPFALTAAQAATEAEEMRAKYNLAVRVVTGLASGTGAANPPSPSVKPNAGTASGTGTAHQPTVSALGSGTMAPAGLASGTGAALAPSVKVSANAGLAAGTGAAQTPTVTVKPSAGAATGTGAAQNPSTSIKPSAGLAAGTGAALQPSASVKANVGLATGTGQAFMPVVQIPGGISVPAETATGTGAAQNPSASVKPNAGAAAGTGAANQPSVVSAPTTNAPAGLSSGVGIAFQPTVVAIPHVSAPAGLASGTGSAGSPSVSIKANAGLADGVGTAFAPTVTTVTEPVGGVGDATLLDPIPRAALLDEPENTATLVDAGSPESEL